VSAWTIPSYAEWAVPGHAEERLLGHGVSGRVVAAVNEATGQRVAIKYLDASLVRDTGFLSGFRSAAERLMSLEAAHMVRLFDYVEQPGQGAAIVTELVDGVSLREMLARRGPLDAAAALVVLKDSLLGLAGAHSRRVPHRDLKPDNVLIDAGGWCKLTDCGVAVKTDKQLPAAGTPAYMAPELWHGAPNVPATDIYAATGQAVLVVTKPVAATSSPATYTVSCKVAAAATHAAPSASSRSSASPSASPSGTTASPAPTATTASPTPTASTPAPTPTTASPSPSPSPTTGSPSPSLSPATSSATGTAPAA